MRRCSRLLVALALGWLALHSVTSASEVVSHHQPVWPPGCQMVEETVFKEVVKHTCKYVAEVKKVRKTVYECKEEPFCLPRCGHCLLFGHNPGCGDCGSCEPVRMKKILVKREIVTEVPVCRCVVEACVEKVPMKVYRPVPCAPPPTAPR